MKFCDLGKEPMPAITRDKYHRYTYQGVTYPGVTGIIGVVDKSDALVPWASRKTAEAAIALGDELPKLLATVGKEGVTKMLTSKSSWENDTAKDIGTAIHDYADRLAKGETLDEVDPAIQVRALNYAQWHESCGWKFRVTEAFIINPVLGYGGTLDVLAYDEKGETVLADVKSGKGVYPVTKLQLLAYGDPGNLIARPGDTQAFPMPHIDRFAVLHVTDSGVREIGLDITPEDLAAFEACIPLSKWHKANKDRL